MRGINWNSSNAQNRFSTTAAFTSLTLFLIILMAVDGFCVSSNPPILQQFENIYEPSAVIVNSVNGVIVLEDEGRKVVHLLKIIGGKGKAQLKPVASYELPVKVNDLEGAAIGKKSEIIAVTSHSITKSGKKKASRELLLHLSLEQQGVTVENSAKNLLSSVREKLIKELALDSSLVSDINIEAICFTPDKDTLLLGLRTPLKDKKTIVLKLLNPYDFLGSGGKKRAVFSDQSSILELGGGGIRAMAYDRKNAVYLIANEVKNKKGKSKTRLWSWDGKDENPPKRLYQTFLKETKVKNIEGIAVVQREENRYFLLVCDDGKKSKNKGAHYLFLPVDIR